MQVIMSMEEYEEMKSKIDNIEKENDTRRISYENSQRLNKSLLKSKDLEIEKYKKINDMAVNFFTENKVGCSETISQSDRILENLEGFVINLFEATQDQFLIECNCCKGLFAKDEIIKCEICGNNFCKEGCVEDNICDSCRR